MDWEEMRLACLGSLSPLEVLLSLEIHCLHSWTSLFMAFIIFSRSFRLESEDGDYYLSSVTTKLSLSGAETGLGSSCFYGLSFS